MATIPAAKSAVKDVQYPTRDGRPIGETEVHRDNLIDLVQTLQNQFAADPKICITGNLMMYYVPGDKHRHLSPDVFVVRGVPKRERIYYLVWEEGKAPDLVIELTSKTTRKEDQQKKFLLYRDTLRVGEYFLFDPYEEYLKPSFQGYRLADGEYVPIIPEAGRLPSAVLGLDLVRDGKHLRVYDPRTGQMLPREREISAALRQTAVALQQTEAALRQRDEEIERLRQELERLRQS